MKAYLVEDDQSMRMILKLLLKRNFPSIEVIGESETAETALEEIPSFHADVILVDISLPGMDGIELISRLKPRCQETCILVVTGHDIDLYAQRAHEAGAHGIVSKSEFEELLSAIRGLLEKGGDHGCD